MCIRDRADPFLEPTVKANIDTIVELTKSVYSELDNEWMRYYKLYLGC